MCNGTSDESFEMNLTSVIRKELLEHILAACTDYLKSRAAVYESDGSYAVSIFNSDFCRTLHDASGKLPEHLCNNGCREIAIKAIESKQIYTKSCPGGITVCAAPIIWNSNIIGASSSGISAPPKSIVTLKKIASNFDLSLETVKNLVESYNIYPGPELQTAKKQIERASSIISEIFNSRTKILKQSSALEEEIKKLEESERKYRYLFENAADAIFTLDSKGRFTDGNKAVERISGFKMNELIGRSSLFLFCKEDREMARAQFFKSLRHQIYGFKARICPKTGGVKTLLLNAGPIKKNGLVVGIQGIARDITAQIEDQKKIEESYRELERSRNALLSVLEDVQRAKDELKVSEERYREVFEGIAEGIYRTTPDGKILLANPAIVKMLGFSSTKELMQRNVEKEGYPLKENRKLFKEKIERYGKVRNFESVWIRKDGNLIFVRENARVVKDEKGNILYYEGTVRDITEQKKTEEKLKRYYQRLETLYELSQKISIAHSIRKLCRIAFNHIRKVLPTDAFFMDRYDEKNDAIVPILNIDLVNGKYKTFTPAVIAKDKRGDIHQKIIDRREPVLELRTPDTIQTAKRARFGDVSRPSASLMYVPMISGEKITGIISVQSYKFNAYTEEDLNFLQSIANQLAIAIEDIDRYNMLQEAKNQITSARNFLLNLIQNAGDAVITVDKKGTITEWNEAASQIYGYKRDEIIGKNIEILQPDSYKREIKNIIKNVIKGRTVKDLETLGNTKSGKIVHILTSASPIKDEREKIFMIAFIARDITERRHAYEKLQKMHESLMEANTKLREAYEQEKNLRESLLKADKLATLGQMGAKIAHEINNPLSVISAIAQFQKDIALDPEIRGYFEKIYRNCEQIESITRGFIDLSKPRHPVKRLVHPHDILNETLDFLSRVGESKRFNIVRKYGEDIPKINADRNKISQVFQNILINAFHAMEDTPRKQLTVKTAVSRDGKWVQIKFTDTGCGIEQENIDKIFDLYYTTKPESMGTGLGLVIVKDIVEKEHNGAVKVKSRVGSGTTFTVKLPVAEKEEFRAKILIVDDEPSILDIYAEFLSRRNFSVAKALNSEEALEIYSTFKPDIVLTDIKMPVMDGFQLSRQIKEINPEQRIVMMTGFDFEPEVRNQLEKNNYPYFTKPADLEGTVLRVIKEEISRMKR